MACSFKLGFDCPFEGRLTCYRASPGGKDLKVIRKRVASLAVAGSLSLSFPCY